MSAEVVLAVYRPKPGKDAALLEIVKRHLPALRRHGLITNRAPMLLRSKDAYIEIFEWVSNEAAGKAHTTPQVAEIWAAMGEVAEFPALGELVEAQGRFPHFVAVDGVLE